ncbi:Ribosome biogenesis protein bms1 [Amphibalanus amphitrite]|uniref:Ribosome biogenesis protein bms1 n=1 Tax=Amphibalanus amphitrite TaxID=1232801 RepID=A0A6A4XEZ9_AMPAM|nr:Ribosome biogenesis protein bms1 [Amphibalanus amphitrite]
MIQQSISLGLPSSLHFICTPTGRKADKKKQKEQHQQELTAKQRNPKAFAFRSAYNVLIRLCSRPTYSSQDIKERKTHIPVIDRTPLEPPPIVIGVVGPPKVGKSTLVQCLIKNFTRKTLTNIQGPVTIVSAKKRRLTFIECNNDINCMIDLAKVVDLVLLLVDASFGFEMETFEFLNICQVHGFPRVMGVLTHLDMFKDVKKMRKTKKTLKHRFWTDVYPGAKLFYLSGMVHGDYQRMEVHNLGRFISVMKFRPLTWKQAHPYILADRMEDLTPAEEVRQNPKCDRRISMYGYVRGVPLKPDAPIHIPGAGDFRVAALDFLPDPCPLPERSTKSRRSLTERDKSMYAPMSGVGGIVYDKDAVYIELGGSHSHSKKPPADVSADAAGAGDDGREEHEDEEEDEDKQLVSSLMTSQHTIDQKMEEAQLQLFSGQQPISSQDAAMKLHYETVSENDGRKRRRVLFDDAEDGQEGAEDGAEGAEEDEEGRDEEGGESEEDGEDEDGDVSMEEDAEEAESSLLSVPARSSAGREDSEEDSDEESEDEEDAPLKPTAPVPRQNARQLHRLIYGAEPGSSDGAEPEGDTEHQEVGGLFRVVRAEQRDRSGRDEVDRTLPAAGAANLRDWTTEEGRGCIADCFVTGEWKESENASTLLAMDDDGLDSDELDGDFEDMETGEKHQGTAGAAAEAEDGEGEDGDDEMPVHKEKEQLTRKQIIEKKKKLKAMFDAEYDDKEGSSFYDDLKRDLDQQAQLNRSEFDGVEDELRVQFEGYRPGMYVRLEVAAVPCELVAHFDPTYPLIVGGLTTGEENIGYVQARIKRHRWYGRTLKTRDPLIVSLGWRRFQTLPLYSIQDHNGRNRLLKYTPDHLHCTAHFWGPVTPQGTGLLALQSVSAATAAFRVAATGTVLDLDKSAQVVKKLKLVGTPHKVMKKTAFIQGMFTSTLEAAKFEGALCRTVSGVRGQLKKALTAKPAGLVRATFEDHIKMSDVVFVRTWYPMEVARLYAPVTSLLLPPAEKARWQGMKTVGQLKRERGIRVEPNPDQLYTPVERKARQPRPLKVPAALQRQLPYAERAKLGATEGNTLGGPSQPRERVAVVLQPREQKVMKMLNTLRATYDVQQQKRRGLAQDRAKKMVEKRKEDIERFEKRQKRVRKHVYKMLALNAGGGKRGGGAGGGGGGGAGR